MGRNKRSRNPSARSSPKSKVSKVAHLSVSLRLDSGSAAFVCGTEELPLPPHLARRSELIADLLNQSDEFRKDVPVQVSLAEARAWLELAEAPSQDGTEESLEARDEKILQALKVADFLRDSTTIDELTWQVLALINRRLPKQGKKKRQRKKLSSKVPTTDERQRAMQIVERIPAELLPKVFAAVTDERIWNPNGDPVSLVRKCADDVPGRGTRYLPLTRLLQLLPRTFHPAITAASCADEEDAAALTIGPMPHCLMVPTLYDDKPNERYASATFQLLAGATPLAGGSLDHAWCEDGVERVARAATALCDGATDGDALRELTLQLSEGAMVSGASGPTGTTGTDPMPMVRGGTMTKLVLEIPGQEARGMVTRRLADVKPEPPRWCFALAQLRALRAFEVTAEDPRHLHPAELAAALLQLTALERLSVTCDNAWDVPPRNKHVESEDSKDIYAENEDSEEEDRYRYLEDNPGYHPSPGFPVLHSAISRMTKLVQLALHECCYIGLPCEYDDYSESDEDEPGTLVAPEFAVLTRLTSLTLGGSFRDFVPPGPALALEARVRSVPTLRELSLQWNENDGNQLEQLSVRLLTAPELTGLQRVGLRGIDRSRWACASASLLKEQLRYTTPTRLASVTALDLSFGVAGGHGVCPLLTAMPELRELIAVCMGLRDDGMHDLAEALASVPQLTRLDVCGNKGKAKGVLAVVKALVDAGVGGRKGLQDLDLSGNVMNKVDVEAGRELAEQLRKLTALRTVGLPDKMGVEGLGEVVGALGVLPKLRRVRVWPHKGVSEAQRMAIVAPLEKAKCSFVKREFQG